MDGSLMPLLTSLGYSLPELLGCGIALAMVWSGAASGKPRNTGLLAVGILLACAACNKPEPPKKEQPPEPQAGQHAELLNAIQLPIDRAKAVEPQVLDAAKKEQDDIEAQTGG